MWKESLFVSSRPAGITARWILLGVAGIFAVGLLDSNPLWAQTSDALRYREPFLRLCNIASEELSKKTRSEYYGGKRAMYFYEESYAIRALAVAYDMTGEKKYLDTCRRWSDRMVEFQSKMKPVGAYYMNYGRKPGETKGDWFVADSSSIAMGVLATAVRCDNTEQKQKYLDSVKLFAKLVLDNYVRPGGGVTDGFWTKYDGEWWCSTGLFASLTFLLYDETGQEQYLQAALKAIDWFNRTEIDKVTHITLAEAGPTVLMYVFEGYSAGFGHLLTSGKNRRRATLAQWSTALDWMSKNQGGQTSGKNWSNYNSQWGSKYGGLPFHMYIYSREMPGSEKVRADGDRELDYIANVISKDSPPKLTQLVAFTMMSYAERVNPGAMYRESVVSKKP
ncbi:MAG: hypothetical protein JXM70_27710 [Pirellulales bacterium]|nr:hypothetical protein [Pirellulales bacterium]